jgi:hypothetical protein
MHCGSKNGFTQISKELGVGSGITGTFQKSLGQSTKAAGIAHEEKDSPAKNDRWNCPT